MRSVLLSIFVNDRAHKGDGTEYTLREFADDTKLAGAADTQDDCAATGWRNEMTGISVS